eukprot:RCo012795
MLPTSTFCVNAVCMSLRDCTEELPVRFSGSQHHVSWCRHFSIPLFKVGSGWRDVMHSAAFPIFEFWFPLVCASFPGTWHTSLWFSLWSSLRCGRAEAFSPTHACAA